MTTRNPLSWAHYSMSEDGSGVRIRAALRVLHHVWLGARTRRIGAAYLAATMIPACGGSVNVRAEAAHGSTTDHIHVSQPHTRVDAHVGTPYTHTESMRIGTGGAQLSTHGAAGLVVLGALIVSGLAEYVFRQMEGRPTAVEENYIEQPRRDVPPKTSASDSR